MAPFGVGCDGWMGRDLLSPSAVGGGAAAALEDDTPFDSL